MRNASKSSTRLRVGFLAAGALALGLAACDGSNAFGPVGVGPSVVELFAPEQTQGGGEFQVSARAVASVRVDSIVVTVTGGGLDYREVRTNSGRENDVTYTYDVTVPGAISDTIATISAVAFDAQGNQSVVRTRTIRLVDSASPLVTLTVSADTVPQGAMVALTVSASDNIGLSRFGVEVRDPAGAVVFSDSVPGSTSQPHVFQWQVPSEPVFGNFRASGFAVDVSGNRGASDAVTIHVEFQDLDAPAVQILQPVSTQFVVTAGDSLFVRASVQDNVAIESIRFRAIALLEEGAAATTDTINRFTPREISYIEGSTVNDVTVSRYLRFDFSSLERGPTSGAEEPLLIIVDATDSSGRVGSDTLIVTLAHDVVAPTVSIGAPSEGVPIAVGADIPVEFTVADDQGPLRSGVNQITIEVQSIIGNAITGDTTVATLAPPASFSLQDVGASDPIVMPATFNYTIPGASRSDTQSADRFFFIIVTARDVAGNVGADTIRVRSLGPAPAVLGENEGILLLSAGSSPFMGPLGPVTPMQEPRRRGFGL